MGTQRTGEIRRKASAYSERTLTKADYVIQLPSLDVIFKISTPKKSDVDTQKKRIRRLKEEKSPVPEKLRWIPRIINMIDDAQDLLYSAAYISRPLLVRLGIRFGTRFIPYVGWVLLAMDIANIVNQCLSFATLTHVSKKRLVKEAKALRPKMKFPERLFWEFVKKGGWRFHLGAWLQMAQASVTVTGYGLQLGPLFGTMSETIYGAIQAARGKKVIVISRNSKIYRDKKLQDPNAFYIVRNREKETLADKAAHFLTQMYQYIHTSDQLTADDHELLIAATRVAVHVLLEERKLTYSDDRFDMMNKSEPILYIPDIDSTRYALQVEGIDPDIDPKPYTTLMTTELTYEKLITQVRKEYDTFANNMLRVLAPTLHTALHTNDIKTLRAHAYSEESIRQNVCYQIAEEAAETMLSHVFGTDITEYYEADERLYTYYHLHDYFSILGPVKLDEFFKYVSEVEKQLKEKQLFSYENIARAVELYARQRATGCVLHPKFYTTFDDYKKELEKSYEQEKRLLQSIPASERAAYDYIVKIPYVFQPTH